MKIKRRDGSYREVNQDKADKIKNAKNEYKKIDKKKKQDINSLVERIELLEIILDL